MREYQFEKQLKFSEGYLNEGIEEILVSRLPGCCSVVRADKASDINGTDYWAIRQDLPPLSVDVKVRAEDYKLKGHDDLALETWSKVNEKIGWTRDITKRTDFILWYWTDTGRFVLVSFPELCCVFNKYWRDWYGKYKHAVQSSGDWTSECLFVPRTVLMERIMAWHTGIMTLPTSSKSVADHLQREGLYVGKTR